MGSGSSSAEEPNSTTASSSDTSLVNLCDDDEFGPKVVQLFNFIENIRGSKDNSISWTEVEDFFKHFKGMGLSESVRNRKETMKKMDKNDDNRISLHEFRGYINECAHKDWSATRIEIQTELNMFEKKMQQHERDRRAETLKHVKNPGLIAKIKLSGDTAITKEDILDAHLFYENHDTAPRLAGMAPKGANHEGVFNWIQNVFSSEKHTKTIERTLNRLLANRRLWRDPNNSGQRDFSDLQKACRSARHRIGLNAEKSVYAKNKLPEELGALGRAVRYKLPPKSPGYLYGDSDVLSHVDWKLIKHLDESPCVGGAALEKGALVLAKHTDTDGEPSERYYDAIVTKCHSTTHYELLYYTKEVNNKAVPRQDHYLPLASSDLYETEQLYLVAVTCLALAFMPLASLKLSEGLKGLPIKFCNRPLIGCCGKPSQEVTGNGICIIRPLHDIFRELSVGGGRIANAHAPRPAAALNYIRSIIVCKDVACLKSAFAAVSRMGPVVGVSNCFTRGFDAVDCTGGVRYLSVQILLQHGGDHLEEGNMDYSWGTLFDKDTTKERWKSWLAAQTGSVRRGYGDVDKWLKDRRVREHQAMFIFTVELHLEAYCTMLETWPFQPLSVIIDAPLPKSLYTRYAQAYAATKIQAARRGSTARSK